MPKSLFISTFLISSLTLSLHVNAKSEQVSMCQSSLHAFKNYQKAATEMAKMQLKNGDLTKGQYKKQNELLKLKSRAVSEKDCLSSSDARYQFYACLTENNGNLNKCN